MRGIVHQGFVFQEAKGVRIALAGASYFIAHTSDVDGAMAKSVAAEYPWSPAGSAVHPAILEPAVAKCAPGNVWEDGVPIAKFSYCVGARTEAFTELFVTGDMDGSLLIGKHGVTLRKSRVPFVLSPEAVENGWMPGPGESAMPASLELDFPPELRYWNPAEGVDAKAIRDFVVKSEFMHEGNVGFYSKELRRLELMYQVPERFPVEGAPAPAPPEFEEEATPLAFAEITKALDPDSLGERKVRLLKSGLSKKAGVEEAPADLRYLLGVVLEPNTVDSQNEFYNDDEIRKSAHKFLATYRNVGLQHVAIINGLAEIVESYIAPVDMDVEGEVIKKGTWLMGIHVLDDELWEACKDDTLTGLSVGGLAVRHTKTEAA